MENTNQTSLKSFNLQQIPQERTNNRNNVPSTDNNGAATFWGPMKLEAHDSCDNAVPVSYPKCFSLVCSGYNLPTFTLTLS